MHKSYNKTVAILITCALISASFCLPISAESSFEALPITVTKLWSNNVDNNTYTQDADNYVTVRIPYYSTKSQFASIWQIQNSDTSNYYDYKFQFVFSIIEPSDFTCTLNGVSYEVKKDTAFDYTYYVEISQVKLTTANARLDFNFSWSAATTGYMYVIGYYRLSDVNAILENQDKNASEIMQNQNENTQAEIEADKENTQAIIDNQNELAEQEKQEITDSGNQATDAGDNIPNESDGFIDALGTFVDTMSTTSTECSLTFPAIKIPSFAGIPATTLSEEREVDISAAVGLIPEDIMKLIQALTTIALIVYCFKELYDTISEALTRKKANSDG